MRSFVLACILTTVGLADPVIGTDLFPAILNLTAARQEDRRDTDGMSLLSIVREPGKKFNRDHVITWHFPHYHPEFVNTKAAVVHSRRQLQADLLLRRWNERNCTISQKTAMNGTT